MQGNSARNEANGGGSHSHEPPSLKLEEFLPYRLNVLASLVPQALSQIYSRRYDIGVPEWRILVTLGQFGVMSGKAIGLHTHMHKTKVSCAVAMLERRRLLARRTNRPDQRESLLSLTPSGRAVYEELAPGAIAFAQRLVEGLGSAEREMFDRVLTHLTERSSLLLADASPPLGERPGGDMIKTVGRAAGEQT